MMFKTLHFNARGKAPGFTLVEMAVVLVVLGLLLGSVLMPLSTQVQNHRIKSTQQTLKDAREAIIGFALVNNFIPCADTNNDGQENRPCNAGGEGFLPHVTLGIQGKDGWGRRLRYRPDSAYVNAVPANAQTTNNLSIEQRDATVVVAAPEVVAIIFSCGQDGKPNDDNDANGVTNTTSDCSNPGNPNTLYIDDVWVQGTPTNDYDDVTQWIAKSTIISRLAASGKWP